MLYNLLTLFRARAAGGMPRHAAPAPAPPLPPPAPAAPLQSRHLPHGRPPGTLQAPAATKGAEGHTGLKLKTSVAGVGMYKECGCFLLHNTVHTVLTALY